MIIDLRDFKGLYPKLSATELPEQAAVTAENVTFKSGAMKPLLGTTAVTTLKTGSNTSIFLYERTYWLSWLNAVVNVVPSPVSLDAYKRLYWTGDSLPKMGGLDRITTGGSGTYPVAAYRLGIPKPASKITGLASIGTRTKDSNGKIFLKEYEAAYIASSTCEVWGVQTGLSLAFINSGITAVTIRAGIGRVAFPATLASYTFKAQGNVLTVYASDATTVIATIAVQEFGLKLTFTDKTVKAMTIALDAISVGGTNAATGTPATLTPTVTDVTLTTSMGVSPSDGLTEEYRGYYYTYVSAYGEEGPPSDPSDPFDCFVNWSVALSGMSTGPARTDGMTADRPTSAYVGDLFWDSQASIMYMCTARSADSPYTATWLAVATADTGLYNITHKNIYRAKTGTNATEYQFVAQIAVATTTYTDTKNDSSLGEVCPSENWYPPPTDLQGLICLPCGSMCGYRGKDLFFSVPYLPHAWNYDWIMSFPSEIEGIGSYGSSILVATTEGAPYVVTGQTPEAMSSERLEIGNGCIASRGLVDMGYSIVYPSVDGLMSVGVNGVSLLTDKIMNRAEWNSLFSASGFFALYYDKQYIAFTSAGNYVFDPQTGDLAKFVLANIVGGWTDPADGTLYLATNANTVVKWESATGSNLTMTWKSKVFTLPYPLNFAAMQIFADSYTSLTAKVYADGVLKHTQTVSSVDPFRPPAGFRANNYQIELSGTVKITRVLMATSMQELRV